MDNETLRLMISIISGIATTIPLIITLIKYVEKAIKEKNWNKLLDMVMNLMTQAERMFDDSATRKQWVLAMVKSSADSINYDVDMDAVSKLVDDLCAMSKVVNGNSKGSEESQTESSEAEPITK